MSLWLKHEHNNKSHLIVDAVQKEKYFIFSTIESMRTVITARIANCLQDLPFLGYNKRARR